MRSNTGLPDTPTANILIGNSFEDGNVWNQRMLLLVLRSVEVEIGIDGTDLVTELPSENVHQVMDEFGVRRSDPHRILLSEMGIKIVGYLLLIVLFDVLCHVLFVSCDNMSPGRLLS